MPRLPPLQQLRERHVRRFRPILLLSLWALPGCATSAADLAPPSASSFWTPDVSPAGTILPGPARDDGSTGYVLPPNPALAALPSPPPIDSGHSYNLAELIDIAESNNQQTRIAWDQARQAALAAGIAASAYLPDVTASAVGAYQNSNVRNSISGFGSSGDNSAHGVISVVSLRWLLFDFGERAATLRAARQLSAVSDIGFTAVHQQVIYNVCLAFYAYAAARGRARAAAQSLAEAEAIEAAAAARYRHDIGTIVDADQAIQATAQARLAVVQANGDVQDTYLSLLTAMGISPLTVMAIADPPPHPLSPDLDKPVREVVAGALARRPDTLGAYAAEQASFANVQAARADFMPKIFLSANGAYSSGELNVTSIPGTGQQQGIDNLSGSHLSGTILAGITFPLYDGGTRAAVLEQAEAGANSAEAALQKDQDEAARQVVNAANGLQTSLAAYSAAQALAQAAQTSYDAALFGYRNGIGSVTTAAFAETQLLQAGQGEANAYWAALTAAATLAFTAGALGAAMPD